MEQHVLCNPLLQESLGIQCVQSKHSCRQCMKSVKTCWEWANLGKAVGIFSARRWGLPVITCVLNQSPVLKFCAQKLFRKHRLPLECHLLPQERPLKIMFVGTKKNPKISSHGLCFSDTMRMRVHHTRLSGTNANQPSCAEYIATMSS